MKRGRIIHVVSTLLLGGSWLVFGLLILTGLIEVRRVKDQQSKETHVAEPSPTSAYPIPGRAKGTTAFFHESKASQRANKSYPEWLRGNGLDGFADRSSRYRYTQLVGPHGTVESNLHANRLQFGTLTLNPRTTYPAHNHPSPEIYFILEGEADWYVDDEKEHVTAGSVIFHRPYAVHGWRNDSTKPLRALWIWWSEWGISPEDLRKGARFTNPGLAGDEKTALPHHEPLSRVRPNE
jgi:quercetin dioxygenase-like cupin family protein